MGKMYRRKLHMPILMLLAAFMSHFTYAQGRMVINDDAFVVMDSSVKIVLANPNANALTTAGTGGNIISEDETNEIIWHIGTNTGTYVIPFTTTPVVQGGNGTKMPFSMQVTTAGVGTGSIAFSTYETATDQNLPYPAGVTNMNAVLGGSGSLYTIDRFWRIDTANYTTNPVATMIFGYDNAANEIGGANTITESNLIAQRYNDTLDSWQALPFGTNDAANNRVTGVTSGPAFFPVWTLVDDVNLLPITLTTFTGYCDGGKTTLNWTTATETDNAGFELEKSYDGLDFWTIDFIEGAGTSTAPKQYTAMDSESSRSITYYRLTQIDLNGATSSSPIIAVESCASTSELSWVLFPNPTSGTITVSGDPNTTYPVRIFDAAGRLTRIHAQTEIPFDLRALPPGIYFAEVAHPSGPQRIKFILQR